ncbi:DUF3341 domain-containing protein [bacterium]|nr:DUF3341 domain-containing protein [bacterium]
MSTDYVVVGHFKFVDDARKAIISLRNHGLVPKTVLYSPVPNHDLEEELYYGKKRSPVRRFTLLGALTGLSGAFLMTCWMSLDYPLRVSAKPLVSIPSFVVIGFECTILLGAIFTLIGMLHNSRIPHIFSSPGYRPNFSKDIFGLVVRVAKDQAPGIESEFRSFGAEKVESEYVR